MTNKDIKVENIFGMKADFIIELIHQRNEPEEDIDPKKKKKKALPPPRKKGAAEQPKEDEVDLFVPPFSTKITTLTVPKGSTINLPVQFLPFSMEDSVCHLIFRDDKVGEMQYTLKGSASLPTPIEFLPPNPFYLENEMLFQIPIELRNPRLETGRKLHIERLPQVYKLREQEREKAIREKERAAEFVVYEIEPQTSYISVQPTITIFNTKKQALKNEGTDKKLGGAAGIGLGKKKLDASFVSGAGSDMVGSMLGGSKVENKLPVTLQFKTATKDHPLRFILRSQNKQDIRVYEFKVTVLPKPIKAILEMRCPAREPLIQDIPVKNDTDKEWTIRGNLTADASKNGGCFSLVSKDLRIPKGQIGNYQVVFRPPWILEAEAHLTLNNQFTGQQYEFELRGIGEEPLAEGHVILECVARKTRTFTFPIKNEGEKRMAYRVETDLYNASGKSSFELGPGKTEEYVLEVTPVLGGAYTGSITFFDEEGHYKWWTVEVHTESPKAEKIIDLITTIRKAIAFEIAIANPLDEKVVFEVILNGEGLLGETAFTILPKQTATYELVYSPLKPSRKIGSIAFIHEKLGEVWYDLNLEASEPVPVRLPTLKAELGKVEAHEVELENPSNKEVRVRAKLSNDNNFDTLPEDIVIQPYDTEVVKIRYMPSDLDIMDTCEVTFETDDIGSWKYLAFGQGIPPTKFETQIISGALNRDVSATINFKNPFKESINIYIDIEGSDESLDVFKILLKKFRMSVAGLNIVQIPISFLPKNINDYYAELVVAMNEKIKWRYPIKGVTESFSNASDFYVKTKCRTKLEKVLKINLAGNPSINPDDTYTVEITNVPKDYEKLIHNPSHKGLTFVPVKNSLDDPSESLEFKAVFNPLKPFKTNVDLVVIKSTGGRWKFKLYLEATFPDPDDTILITSAINKTSSVSFKLNNYSKYAAEFNAAFTADSDTEFTVLPKSGVLEPAKNDIEGTTFIISFTPLEYGKQKTGKLVIQTDEMLWSFNVRGSFPKYIAPRIQSARIENKLPNDIVKRLTQKTHRNFLVENIKRNSPSPTKRDKPRSRSNSRSRSKSPKIEGYSIYENQKDQLKEKKAPTNKSLSYISK